MLYCPGCGRAIIGNDSVCPACGLSLIRDIRQRPDDFGKRPEPEAPYQMLICNYCNGTGTSPGNDMVAERCPVCKGSGRIKVKTPYEICHNCNGTGCRRDIIGSGICSVCGGTGRVSKIQIGLE